MHYARLPQHVLALWALVAATSCVTESDLRAREAVAQASADQLQLQLDTANLLDDPEERAEAKKLRDEALEKAAKAEAERELLGGSFGVAPAVIFGGRTSVQDASIENGVVRVSESTEERAAVLLEAHYFPYVFEVEDSKGERHALFGTGPFLALGLESTDSVLDGVGLGWMIGWGPVSEDTGPAFNIGVGAYLDPKVTVLASGFFNGEAPPAGETQVRTESVSDVYGVVLVSFAWKF